HEAPRVGPPAPQRARPPSPPRLPDQPTLLALMALPKLDKLFSDTPAWRRLFNRDYQLKTVMRMNDLLSQNRLTQKEVCERTGWSKGYVSRLLSGRGNLT